MKNIEDWRLIKYPLYFTCGDEESILFFSASNSHLDRSESKEHS